MIRTAVIPKPGRDVAQLQHLVVLMVATYLANRLSITITMYLSFLYNHNIDYIRMLPS